MWDKILKHTFNCTANILIIMRNLQGLKLERELQVKEEIDMS